MRCGLSSTRKRSIFAVLAVSLPGMDMDCRESEMKLPENHERREGHPIMHGYLHKFENRLKMGGMDLKICDLNLG